MNQGSDHGVWIDDYGTSGGTRVAGHWRRRAETTPSRTSGPEPATGQTPHRSGGADPIIGENTGFTSGGALVNRSHAIPTPTTGGGLTEAADRYQRAQVAAGMVALRQRYGRDDAGRCRRPQRTRIGMV